MTIKTLRRILNIAFYCLVGVVSLASVGSAVFQKPLLFSAIKSNSMVPLFQRGDMVFVQPLGSGAGCKAGDIVLFNAEEGSLQSLGWICHRIVGGDVQSGFITQGDANEYPDQLSGDERIQAGWIGGKVLQIGGGVAKVRFAGYLSIWMEQLNRTPFTLPVIVAVLAVLLAVGELGSKKKKKAKKTSYATLYVLSGAIMSVVVGASMLSAGQHIVFVYQVGDAPGAMSGSPTGILIPGQSVTQPVSDLNNKGFIPVVATITSRDTQLRFSHSSAMVRTGDEIRATVTVTAQEKGNYSSVIDVGIFYPFLPQSTIYALAARSYWLALAVLSLIPGLPLLCVPLLDGRMRARALRPLRTLRLRLLG